METTSVIKETLKKTIIYDIVKYVRRQKEQRRIRAQERIRAQQELLDKQQELLAKQQEILAEQQEIRAQQERELRKWEAIGQPIPAPHSVKQTIVEDYAKRFSLRTMIETGTCDGDMV